MDRHEFKKKRNHLIVHYEPDECILTANLHKK